MHVECSFSKQSDFNYIIKQQPKSLAICLYNGGHALVTSHYLPHCTQVFMFSLFVTDLVFVLCVCFFPGVSKWSCQWGNLQTNLLPIFPTRRLIFVVCRHCFSTSTFVQWHVLVLTHADASTYAHYLFNAFDTAQSGIIKFEVNVGDSFAWFSARVMLVSPPPVLCNSSVHPAEGLHHREAPVDF